MNSSSKKVVALRQRQTQMVTVIKRGSIKEAIAKGMRKLAEKSLKKGFNAHKFCGTLKIKEDALVIQKRLRDEWE